MMSNSMFVAGESNTAPRFRCVELAPGTDFIVGAATDTRFSQRGRIGRLIAAVAHYPQDPGLGIDQNTATVVDGAVFEVVGGGGAVTVVDAGGMDFPTLAYARRGDPLTLIEEHGARRTFPRDELYEFYLRAGRLLKDAQHPETLARLRECARIESYLHR